MSTQDFIEQAKDKSEFSSTRVWIEYLMEAYAEHENKELLEESIKDNLEIAQLYAKINKLTPSSRDLRCVHIADYDIEKAGETYSVCKRCGKVY